MNHLSFRSITDDLNGLSFELLIDGKPLTEAVGCDYSSIPYWLVEGDLLATNEMPSSLAVCNRIVAVCSCGEFGCGGAHARVTKNSDTVKFSDFAGDIQSGVRDETFVFTRSNYDEVVRQMTELGIQYRTQRY